MLASSGGDLFLRIGAFAAAFAGILVMLRTTGGVKVINWIAKHWRADADARLDHRVQVHVDGAVSELIGEVRAFGATTEQAMERIARIDEEVRALQSDLKNTLQASATDRRHLWRAIGRIEGRLAPGRAYQSALTTDDIDEDLPDEGL